MSTIKVQDIQHTGNSNDAISLASDSSVALKHSGSSKLTTSSTGVSVTGTCTATEFSGSAASLTALPAANLTGTLPAIDGSNLTGISTDLVGDTSPQLGGDLDMNSNFISSGILGIKNTGSQSELRLYCEVSNLHYASIKAPAHANFSGNLTYTLPSGYGSNGQVLKSDGSGGTSWVDQPTANATHTGEVTGSTALTIADDVVDEANLKVSNTPTDGYVLTAQSGNAGGLTWAEASSGLSSDAQYNTVGGTNAGDSFTGTDAENNTLIGYDAGTAITSGDNNVAIGFEALKSGTTITKSVMVGYQAGKECTGSWNTFIGYEAGKSCTSGTTNVIIGTEAGTSLTTSSDTVLIGYQTGNSITTGTSNTLVGYYAGASVTGGGNTILGRASGGNITSGGGNIVIGEGAAASSATVSNEITLGNNNITKFRIPGCDGFEIDDNGTIDLGGAINENIFAITDASSVALDPDNGMIQTWTLGANRTVTSNLTNGQSMLLIVTASSSNYTLTWPNTMKWVGGSNPTLGGANPTAIELFYVGSQLYGATVGDLS